MQSHNNSENSHLEEKITEVAKSLELRVSTRQFEDYQGSIDTATAQLQSSIGEQQLKITDIQRKVTAELKAFATKNGDMQSQMNLMTQETRARNRQQMSERFRKFHAATE